MDKFKEKLLNEYATEDMISLAILAYFGASWQSSRLYERTKKMD